MEWYLAVLKKYADFSGRARRKEYWMFMLFHCLICFVLGMIGEVLFVIGIVESQGESVASGKIFLTLGFIVLALYCLYALATLIPYLAVTVRRLHDTGRPGTHFFIGFIPIVGPIFLIIYCCEDSKWGANAYGPNPKGIDAGYSPSPV